VVFITVQTLLGIDAVVMILCVFFRFREFGLRTPISVPKIGVLSDLKPLMGSIINETQKAHPCASPHRLSHHARKSVDASQQ